MLAVEGPKQSKRPHEVAARRMGQGKRKQGEGILLRRLSERKNTRSFTHTGWALASALLENTLVILTLGCAAMNMVHHLMWASASI